jgi:outer membrane cobalamin receptor
VSTLTGDRTPLMLVDGVRISDIGALESIDPGSVTRIEVAAGSVGGWAQGLEGASGVIHIHTHRGRSAADPYCGATTGRRARSSD